MPGPGFEPGLLRPQRNVLTTIRSRLPLLLTCTANFQTDKAYASRQKYLLPYTFILVGNYIFLWLLTPLFFQWYFSTSVLLVEIALPSRFFFLFISFRRRSRECRSLDFLPKEIRRLATQEKRMRCSRSG